MSDFEPKQFGKYYLLEKLAVGGMAEIYKAKTFGVDGFEKELAIKRILPHCSADKDFISMLIDEAKLSVMLSHANIVQVYDLGKVGDDYFISMEFIHGINLRDLTYRCREDKLSMPLDIAIYIASEICKGLDYAHRKTDQQNVPLNIVHRDVSPQNILISYEGEVKIVDFGIAKAAMNISHTMAGMLKGKIAYMSPEQAMGKAVDWRTDIFSAGILLYEMITGTKLFTGESQFEVLKKIRTSRITVDSLPDSVPEQIRPILAKTLAYNVEERYLHAGDLQTHLTKLLYTTYSDFSPRKLSTFIKEVFAGELVSEKIVIRHEKTVEKKTGSLIVSEGAKQLDIVHRDGSLTAQGKTVRRKIVSDTSFVTSPTARTQRDDPEVPTESKRVKKKRTGLKFAISAVLIAAIGGAVYFATSNLQFIKEPQEIKVMPPLVSEPVREPEPVAENGTINIITDPTGAAILVDGRLTGLTTPATIEKLSLNKELRITLSKPEYEDFEQVLTLTSSKPQRISTKLKTIIPQSGKLVINSNPAGALVMLNGKETGRTTPATLANLEPQRYTVALTMSGYQSWTGTFEVTADQAVPVEATLAATASPQTSKPTTEPEKPKPAQPEIKPETQPLTEKGSLKISSTPPGAKIVLDGRDTGLKTPATIPNLKTKSTYSLRFDLDGYKSVVRKKTIEKETDSLSATLTKEEKKEEKPVTAVEPPVKPQKPEPITPTPPEKIESKGGTGTIKIASSPSGADVFINSQNKGRTPLTVTVPAGKVSVLVNKEGMGRFSKEVKVGSGQTVNLTDISLGEMFGEVTFSSEPPKAQVTFDGQTMPAPTPVTVKKVKRGSSHTVTVKLPGYRAWSRTFTLEESSKSFNVTLQPE